MKTFWVIDSIMNNSMTCNVAQVVPVTYVIDEKKGNRKKIVWVVALFTYIIGIPSALSQGASGFFTAFSVLPARLSSADFLGHMSFIWGDFSLAFGAFFLSIFVGWVWGGSKAADEIEKGSPGFAKTRTVWIFMIRYFIPIVIFLILLNLFGIFD